MIADALVAGGGIAGSAAAMFLARAGLQVELFERFKFPKEKACGEGIMPAGVAVLERLGVLDAVGGARFHGVRYHCGDQVATGAFPRTNGVGAEGLAQRRTVLDQALFEAAAATPGVRAHTSAGVESPIRDRGRVTGLVVKGVAHHAGLVVAADGVHSQLRRALDLDVEPRRPRFGLRAHFRLASDVTSPPWVDIFLGADHELYVATLPEGELLIAALADLRRFDAYAEALFERWVRAQPRLEERLRGASQVSAMRGAVPLTRRAREGSVPGMVLLGDAAGSLDPITGCGMSHALLSAELLAGYATRDITASDDWLPEFERARRKLLRDSALLTRGLLWLARHPGLVPPALAALRAWPGLFSHMVGVAGGARSLSGRGRGQEAVAAATRRT